MVNTWFSHGQGAWKRRDKVKRSSIGRISAVCLIAACLWGIFSAGVVAAQPGGTGQSDDGGSATTSTSTGSAGGMVAGTRSRAGRAGTTKPAATADATPGATAEARDLDWLRARLRGRLIPSLWFLPGVGASTPTGNQAAGYMQSWQQRIEQFANAIVPRPPGPQPGPQVRTQIVEEEPVVDSTSGGGPGYPLPEPGNLAVPRVLQAPIVLSAPPPVRVVAAPAAPPPRALPAPVALPPGISLPWVPPRALAEPPPGAPVPKIGNAIPPAHQPVPGVGTSMNPQASFRVGYADYLRTAGVPQLVAIALPGLAGILLLTASGGFIGYRQAKAGSTLRTTSIERFLA
jgi:hypothetical protein